MYLLIGRYVYRDFFDWKEDIKYYGYKREFSLFFLGESLEGFIVVEDSFKYIGGDINRFGI